MVWRRIFGKVFIVTIVCIAVAWSLFPLGYLIMISFTGPGPLPTELELPQTLTYNNWWTVLTAATILPYLLNSLIVGMIVVLVTLAVSLPAAYSFSRRKSKVNSTSFMFLLYFRSIPYISLAIPLYFLVNRYHLLGTLPGLSITHLVKTIPLCVLLMKGFYDMISPTLEEAALIDGASRLKAFTAIVIPITRQGTIVTAIFAFLFSYMDFLYAAMITKAESATLPIHVASFLDFHRIFWRPLACTTLLSLIPMIVIFVCIQRYLAYGLSFGAIK